MNNNQHCRKGRQYDPEKMPTLDEAKALIKKNGEFVRLGINPFSAEKSKKSVETRKKEKKVSNGVQQEYKTAN